jgi:hypothetical protein
MRTTARQTRDNQTITVDFQNEATNYSYRRLKPSCQVYNQGRYTQSPRIARAQRHSPTTRFRSKLMWPGCVISTCAEWSSCIARRTAIPGGR